MYFREIFTTKKIIQSRFLNLIGLQVVRYLSAKVIYLFLSIVFKNKNKIENYNNQGLCLFKKFLPDEEFNKVKEEFNLIFDNQNKSRNIYENEDDPYKHNSSIDYKLFEIENIEDIKQIYPNLYKLYNNDKLNDLFKFAEKKEKVSIFMRLERVITKNQEGKDANSKWHSDNFHDTHKAWLYLTDVSEKNGPFNYILKSNNLSLKRVIWEYTNSIKFLFKKNYIPFFVNEKRDLLQNKLIQIECNKNDFLIANTHGIHRRRFAEINQVRDTISFFTRENPFKINFRQLKKLDNI
jgi:hypothetical protein